MFCVGIPITAEWGKYTCKLHKLYYIYPRRSNLLHNIKHATYFYRLRRILITTKATWPIFLHKQSPTSTKCFYSQYLCKNVISAFLHCHIRTIANTTVSSVKQPHNCHKPVFAAWRCAGRTKISRITSADCLAHRRPAIRQFCTKNARK